MLAPDTFGQLQRQVGQARQSNAMRNDLIAFMKKIEAIMDRPGAELLLADVENDSRLDFADFSIFESRSRFYKLSHVHGHQREWVPCVTLDLFIPDRETECAVKLIREHSRLPLACGGNINVIPIESTLEIGAETLPHEDDEQNGICLRARTNQHR
jgi:hypothetical protein